MFLKYFETKKDINLLKQKIKELEEKVNTISYQIEIPIFPPGKETKFCSMKYLPINTAVLKILEYLKIEFQWIKTEEVIKIKKK
jgi:hypothetical protein